MAIQSRQTLKGWFVTGAKPTQSQFSDWIESFRHISEKIGSADLDNELSVLINSLPTTEVIDSLLASLASKADLVNGVLKYSQWPAIIKPDSYTFSVDGSYSIETGVLVDKVLIYPEESINLKMGTFEGGEDLLPETQFLANTPQIVNIDIYAATSTQIFLTGITSSTYIKFYKR